MTCGENKNDLLKTSNLFPMIAPVKSKQLMIPKSKEVQPYPSRVNFRDVIPLIC